MLSAIGEASDSPDVLKILLQAQYCTIQQYTITSMTRTVSFFLMFGLLVLAAGCSDKAKVSGKVTFSDGTPLTAGTVVFDNGKDQAKGPISENGTYQLGSLESNDGVAPGEYGVYITGALGFNKSVTMKPGTVPRPDDLIDSKFTSKTTSGLKCSVKGTTAFDIQVTPPEKRKK